MLKRNVFSSVAIQDFTKYNARCIFVMLFGRSETAEAMSEFIYGIHPVKGALKSDFIHVQKIYVDRTKIKALEHIIKSARNANIFVQLTDKNLLDKRSGSKNHQGVGADTESAHDLDIDSLLKKGRAGERTVLILDSISDPQNLGAILRSAGAFGVDFIVLPKDRSVQVTPTVSRISSGAAQAVPAIRVVNLARVIEDFKEAGFWIYALEADGGKFLHEVDLSGDVAFILGSEGKGLRPLVKKKADLVCRLPAEGAVSSLNVASATTCALYERYRQLNK